MDVLSDVLAAVRLKGAIFFDIEAAAPFVGETPNTGIIGPRILPGAEHVIMFHLIMAGTCWAALGNGDSEPVRLVAGDVIVFPRGDENVLSTNRGERGMPNMSLYRQPSNNEPLPFNVRHVVEGADRTRFICGFLGCDLRPFNPLLAALPEMILDRNEDKSGWVASLFDIALAEAYGHRAGTDTILAKLSELMFVEVVRRHIESLPEGSRGWLSGLRDRHVGEALGLIHGRPTHTWTLDALAHEVGLSRTTFADRFVQYVGMPPMQYLARWRMQLAARQLETPGLSIGQVASNVGYESEAAFNRAFKKLIGTTPGHWRKRGAGSNQSSVA